MDRIGAQLCLKTRWSEPIRNIPATEVERAALRVALAYEVRERRASRVPAMPLTTNPENRPPGMNQTARSVTK